MAGMLKESVGRSPLACPHRSGGPRRVDSPILNQWHRDERGVPLYRRFSCVGFFLGGLLGGGGIKLFRTSQPETLPEVDLEIVSRAYGEHLRRQEQRRMAVGLPGVGPWRILLAGYVFHSLRRPDHSIRSSPYRVTSVAEGNFPIAP